MTVRVALAQFEITPGDTENNLAAGFSAIQNAVEKGCCLVQLPELWMSGYDLANAVYHARFAEDQRAKLQALSDSRSIVIGGSVITQHNDWFLNTYQLFVPNKRQPAQYSKIHLFRLLDEPTYFTGGDKLAIVDLPWGKVGLALCYDLRFPELIRAYADRGISCLLVAAQWGQKRSDHWRTLLRARAIENQFFVAGTNAIGAIFENYLAGYSAVIDPWGNVVAEARPDEPALLIADLDLAEVERVRQVVPSTSDRRPELYQRWQDEIE